MTRKQMKLGAFINLPGHHVASWRHPSSGAGRAFDLDYLTEIAQTAERGKFDMIFLRMSWVSGFPVMHTPH